MVLAIFLYLEKEILLCNKCCSFYPCLTMDSSFPVITEVIDVIGTGTDKNEPFCSAHSLLARGACSADL